METWSVVSLVALDSYVSFLLGGFFTVVSSMLIFFYAAWGKAKRDVPRSINYVVKFSAAVFLFLGAMAYVAFNGKRQRYDSTIATIVGIFYICFLNFLHYVLFPVTLTSRS